MRYPARRAPLRERAGRWALRVFVGAAVVLVAAALRVGLAVLFLFDNDAP